MCRQRRLTVADLKDERGYCAECGDRSRRVGKWSLEEQLKQRYPDTYGTYRLNSTAEGQRIWRLLNQLVNAGQIDKATFDQTPVKAMIKWLLDYRMLGPNVNPALHLSWEDAEALLRSEVVYLQEQAAPTRSMGPADSEVEAVNSAELPSQIEPPASASTEPRSVMRSIEFYRRILLQDAEDLQLELTRACHNLPGGAYTETISNSIRQRLRIPLCADKSSPRDATATAWHPFILEYCETLGVPSEEVDRLYRRIMGGDLMDSRGLARETKLAKERLDQAFELAESQWHEGDSAIHRGTDEIHRGDSLDCSSGIDGEKEPEWPSKALLTGETEAAAGCKADETAEELPISQEDLVRKHVKVFTGERPRIVIYNHSVGLTPTEADYLHILVNELSGRHTDSKTGKRLSSGIVHMKRLRDGITEKLGNLFEIQEKGGTKFVLPERSKFFEHFWSSAD